MSVCVDLPVRVVYVALTLLFHANFTPVNPGK